MTRQTSVLLLDDGELDDVRELLHELAADVCHLRGGRIPDQLDPPRDLFVSTSRRASAVEGWPAQHDGRPAKLAIVAEDSNTLRRMLRRLGFDFLVRRPVHPVALRLLLLRCLFAGEDRRRHPRAAIGYEVAYRSGLWRRTATLADVSERGLRLLSTRPLPLGTRACVAIPSALAGERGFNVSCRVVRVVQRPAPGGRREFWVALKVDANDATARSQLHDVVEMFRAGPVRLEAAAELRGETPAPEELRPAPAAPIEAAAEAGESEGERRQHRRASYQRSVMSLDASPARVLVGRDLSAGGMRVDPNPGLEPGQRLRLALYGGAREEPSIVSARVVRNDGDAGVALQFEQVDAVVARRIEVLVGSLPSVESLRDEETGSVGTVISEVLAADS